MKEAREKEEELNDRSTRHASAPTIIDKSWSTSRLWPRDYEGLYSYPPPYHRCRSSHYRDTHSIIHPHAGTRARTQTHTHAHADTHTHTRARARTLLCKSTLFLQPFAKVLTARFPPLFTRRESKFLSGLWFGCFFWYLYSRYLHIKRELVSDARFFFKRGENAMRGPGCSWASKLLFIGLEDQRSKYSIKLRAIPPDNYSRGISPRAILKSSSLKYSITCIVLGLIHSMVTRDPASFCLFFFNIKCKSCYPPLAPRLLSSHASYWPPLLANFTLV